MILGFTKILNGKPTNFKEKILAGQKIHTIREDKTNRWKVERVIQFCYGVRRKTFEKFHETKCLGIQRIRIESDKINFKIWVDDKKINETEIVNLAHNDGFDSVIDFCNWFNKDFEGKIIHWTDKKY